MTRESRARAVELPVFLESGEESIFGVFTRTAGDGDATGFIHLDGRGTGGSWGRKRFTLRLCRRLAGEGFETLRLDYRGVGESTGSTGVMSTTRPFSEEVDAGMRALAERGISGVVLSGTCFGGRSALDAAARATDLRGVILISVRLLDAVRQGVEAPVVMDGVVPWHKLRRALRPRVWRGLFVGDRRRGYLSYLKSLRRAVPATMRAKRKSVGDDHWVSPYFLEPLEQLARRGVPVLFVFGSEDAAYTQFERARPGRLGRILERAGERMHVEVLEGRVHGATETGVDEKVIGIVSGWLSRLPTTGDGSGSAGGTSARAEGQPTARS